jgi:SulP family sulfate permease
MRRMAVTTTVELETAQELGLGIDLPPGIRLYEVAGPMFFGAAKSAMEVIATVGSGSDHTFVLNMQHVPTIDVTALVALESALDRLYRSRIKVIFAGLTPEVAELLDRAGIKRQPGRLAYAPDVETAISMAIVHGARLPSPAQPPPAAA